MSGRGGALGQRSEKLPFWKRMKGLSAGAGTCRTGQDRILVEGFVSLANYKQHLLPALRVEEMGNTTTTNSRSIHWVLKVGRVLFTHYHSEPPSQPSVV